MEVATVDPLEVESKLIELVAEIPMIWNKRSDAYKSRKSVKMEKFKAIGETLNLSAVESWNMWNRLRDQYQGFRRKLRKRSGSAAGERPYFRHEKSMGFLSDITDGDGSISNMDASEPTDETKDGGEEQAEDQGNELEEDVSNRDEPGKENGSNDADSKKEDVDGNQADQNKVESPKPCSSKATPDNRKHTKGNKRSLDPVDAEMIRFLNSSRSETADQYAVFGDLVSTKLRKISSQSLRLYHETENLISTILHDAEMQLIDG